MDSINYTETVDMGPRMYRWVLTGVNTRGTTVVESFTAATPVHAYAQFQTSNGFKTDVTITKGKEIL